MAFSLFITGTKRKFILSSVKKLILLWRVIEGLLLSKLILLGKSVDSLLTSIYFTPLSVKSLIGLFFHCLKNDLLHI